MSEILNDLKTSVMLRVSGGRHEIMKVLIDLHGIDIAKEKVCDIYLPFDDPEEDDALDINIDSIKHLTDCLSGFKELSLSLFVHTKSPILDINVFLSDDGQMGDIHTNGTIDNGKINADLQSRIDKAMSNLKGENDDK